MGRLSSSLTSAITESSSADGTVRSTYQRGQPELLQPATAMPGRRLGVDGVNAGFRCVPKGSHGSRDFVPRANGSRRF